MRQITYELIKSFENHLINEEKSSLTVEKYLRDIYAFSLWCKEKELDKSTVLEYKKALCEKYAAASINSILSSLNSFFSYSGWYELKVKLLKIQKQIFLNKDRELKKSEYEKLLRAANNKKNKRLYYLMQTICASGIRVSELKFITVEAAKTGQATIRCKGKMRVIILSNQLCKILLNYAKQNKISSGSIFITKAGKPIDRSTVWKMMKAICDIAGVSREKVFPHNLRHLFARTFYTIQKDIVRLSDILGHSSINTTRIYTMETGEIHRRQIQCLGLIKSPT